MNKAIEMTVEHIIMTIFILILISFDMNPSSRIMDAADCTRKYFMALSLTQLFFFMIRVMMNDIVLISSRIHRKIHDLDEIAIRGVKMIIAPKIMLE